MELVKQLLLVLGIVASPVEHRSEPCMDNGAVSDAGLALVKHFEGYSPVVYQDAASDPTIGFSHLIKPGEKIQEPRLGEAAEKLLQQDIKPNTVQIEEEVTFLANFRVQQ